MLKQDNAPEKNAKKAYQMFLPKTTLLEYETKVVTAEILCARIMLDLNGRNSGVFTRIML
jgi:hypothetical protein